MRRGILLLVMVTGYGLRVTAQEPQRNIYVNQDGRTRIVNAVDSIGFTPSVVKVTGYGLKVTEFDVAGIERITLSEYDTWRGQVMPERYWADFDFDVAFDNDSDRQRVAPEPEITDPSSPYYEDWKSHHSWRPGLGVTVTYLDTSAVITGDLDSVTITRSGAHVTVHTAASGVWFVLKGHSDNGSFKLYSEKKACVNLFGLHLTNPSGPVINSQGKKRLFIEVEGQGSSGNASVLTDGSTYTKVQGEDQRGCIFAEGKICISGDGELVVNANKKCGIASDDYVHVMGGLVHVESHAEKGKAIYGQDNIIIGGGVVRTYSDGDAGKGLSSDSLLTVTGGLVKAITVGNAIFDETEQDYSSACCIKSAWDMHISGGEIRCLSTGTGGKGISAGHAEVTPTKTYYHGKLTFDGGDVYVRTGGERIPAVKQEDSHGQAVGPAASPKGIKSADKMIINDGNIYVRCSGGAAAEGIESKRSIDIYGGKVRTYCVDDGMNAEGCNMHGGDVLICSTENDGFDTRYLIMSGGLLYTIGDDDMQMGLDTDGKTFLVSGGEIVALGARNCAPFQNSSQASVICHLHKNVSGVALADAAGNVLRAIPTPYSYNPLCVLFSNGDIQIGSSYQILSYEHSFNDTPVVEYTFTAETATTQLGQ